MNTKYSSVSKILSLIDKYISTIQEFITTHPKLTLSIIVLVISMAWFIYTIKNWIYIKYLQKKSMVFTKTIANEESISILMHSNPDPDAMASALAVKRLAQSVNTDAVIEYPGWIKHHENRAFRAVLDLTFERVTTYEDIENPESVILVDHQEARGFEGNDKIDPLAIIDHHDSSYTGEADFSHIESDIGACSTILTEYLSQQGLSFDSSENNPDISKKLATGLYYGIKTDTADFSRGIHSSRDYSAAQKLYQRVDTDELFKIANPKIDAETFEVKSTAFHSREVNGPFAISYVGEVSNSDTIPQAADELSRLEGISAVIVMGFDGDILRLSGRTYDSRIHMGSVLENVFGGIENAGAGGHSRMGGGQISKEIISKEGLTIDKIKENLFETLNGNH